MFVVLPYNVVVLGASHQNCHCRNQHDSQCMKPVCECVSILISLICVNLLSLADSAKMGLTETRLAIIPGGGRFLQVVHCIYLLISLVLRPKNYSRMAIPK